MVTKTGRGRVHGVRIADPRQGGGLPNTLLKSIKEDVSQKRVIFEAET